MLQLLFVLSILSFLVNVSQGTLRPITNSTIFIPTTYPPYTNTRSSSTSTTTTTPESTTHPPTLPSTLITNSTIFNPTSYPPYTNTPPSTTTTTPESTTTSTTTDTTPTWTTPTWTTPTWTTPTWTTPTWTTPTRPPTLPPIQHCCGQNEIYLRPGEAPNCDPVCSKLAEKCTKVFIQAPSGCYCLPGYCRDPQGRSELISDAFKNMHFHCHLNPFFA